MFYVLYINLYESLEVRGGQENVPRHVCSSLEILNIELLIKQPKTTTSNNRLSGLIRLQNQLVCF